MTDTLDMALIQTRTPATAAAGLVHVEPLIRQAAAGGAQLILTPEGTNFLEQRRALRDAALSDEGAVLMPPGDYGFSRRFAWVNDRFGVSWQLNFE